MPIATMAIAALPYFSRLTPLNFFALFLTAMNCPPFLLRFVEVFVSRVEGGRSSSVLAAGELLGRACRR